MQLNPKRMKMLKKDYLAKRTKEQEEAVELRVSRGRSSAKGSGIVLPHKRPS